jgi:hypothetical protein
VQQQQRRPGEVAADLAVVGAELRDDVRVALLDVIGLCHCLFSLKIVEHGVRSGWAGGASDQR